MTQGMVFDIQNYSLHDGPGIRTLVFLKGCPLSCIWCQNPESQRRQPEIMLSIDKCTGCGLCVPVCPHQAIWVDDGKSHTRRDLCQGCGKCAEACPNEARTLVGRTMSAEEVFQEVKKDEIFYKKSGGGVTLSGGEPLAQAEFSADILRLCKKAGLHTAIETSGMATWETFKQVLEYVDLVLYDLKHMDSSSHQKCTGVPNSLILENVKRIHLEYAIPVVARVPIIPGFNADPQNIEATARFILTELGSHTRVHILAYHRLGETKYSRLEKEGQGISITPPTAEEMADIKKTMESFGLNVSIGG
ncbi:MAG: glycyl-radical enzyme activating protein [Dehalococcoidales bacterium]|jgi:pyruvate formate lyase activating enzyme|nr:glycyl-radical enzyme activating protein [Dehalococcoidales bacterium]